MTERNQDELFHREIDVAKIMQEIKQKALNMPQESALEEDRAVRERAQIDQITTNLNCILSFVQNTLNSSKSYIEMGAVIPVGARWKGIFRKLIIFARRLVRKLTRFLVEDQLRFNQMSNQNIQALMEGLEQLRQAVMRLQTEIFTNCQQYNDMMGQFNAVYNNMEEEAATLALHTNKLCQLQNSVKKFDQKIEGQNEVVAKITEQVHICEQSYLKFQEEVQKSVLDDALYKEYEDRYRGSEEEIKRRLSYYLPYVAEAIRNQQTESVLDLGCGRGEWMELLKEHYYYEVSGVDFNKSMVERCTEKGLKATCGDAIAYLRQLPDCSVKVVTGFQFAEHLKIGDLAELIAEAYRVLMFHGILILELPNCRNVEVGSSAFYSDPTHIRPVTSDYLEFVAQHKGFYETKTVYWKQQEIDDWLDSVIASDETQALESPTFRTMLTSLRKTHYIAPDYALIATK